MLPNKQTKLNLAILLMAAALCMAAISYAAPMGTAFTYQGRLADANSPAEGLYDFEFEVYDALVGGTQQGTTLSKDDKDVIDGYFTVTLDFGADPNIFDGDARWLQIAVRGGGAQSFTTLSPRQELTPTPYALYAKTAESVSGGVDIEGNGTANTLPKFLNSTTLNNSIVHENDGKIGIGTMSPAEMLDVQGYIRATGLRSNDSIYIRSDYDMEFTIDAVDSAILGFFEVFNGKGQHVWWVNENGNMRNYGDATVEGDMLVNGNLAVDGSLSSPVVRSISIPAGAFDLGSGVSADGYGVDFPAGFANSVKAMVPMPRDWDGSSDFDLTVFFMPRTKNSGVVSFFVRVTGRKAGDLLVDPGSTTSTGVSVNNSMNRLYKQSFTIPASRFAADDDVIHIYGIQRGGTGETYADSVSLKTVEISYTAKR